MIRVFRDFTPAIDATAYVDEAAVVIGNVTIGPQSSIWPGVVLRGDVNAIHVGARTSIQDGTVLHVTHDHDQAPGGFPCRVGDEVTVGHNVTLHGCTVEDRCLIGMGAIVLDGAVVRSGALLAAGSLVPPGRDLEGGYLWLGSPVRRGRVLSTEERERFTYQAAQYVSLAEAYR
ncbi:gamma carbonic anhydrase family protein [Thiohalomonas denitrificans]|uniref:Carbonic anhydrase or acetyltransferase, isoleucine patch superfamily n=1 Tax=Thiohalomonas denitrificans TaxID=415747 RepID=A0A1G5QRM5_9GAMM|nr:gamma carbonic anhydrase family protein [Thiohalomonas denitrificans]SCZ64296.1 Carbonic anhydrase or acetyltransferase, isoleucine patch superfamily [Thiohalomonas denitrificans]